MASELSAHNPELVETLRRNMGNQSLSDNDNSAESTSIHRIFCLFDLFDLWLFFPRSG